MKFPEEYRSIALEPLERVDFKVLQHALVSWIQKSKAQAVTDVLGLDVYLPANILVSVGEQNGPFRLLREELDLLQELAKAPIPRQIQLRGEITHLRAKMKEEPSLALFAVLGEGASASPDEIKVMASDLGPDVVLVEWVFMLFLDTWDLMLVVYGSAKSSKLSISSSKFPPLRSGLRISCGSMILCYNQMQSIGCIASTL